MRRGNSLAIRSKRLLKRVGSAKEPKRGFIRSQYCVQYFVLMNSQVSSITQGITRCHRSVSIFDSEQTDCRRRWRTRATDVLLRRMGPTVSAFVFGRKVVRRLRRPTSEPRDSQGGRDLIALLPSLRGGVGRQLHQAQGCRRNASDRNLPARRRLRQINRVHDQVPRRPDRCQQRQGQGPLHDQGSLDRRPRPRSVARGIGSPLPAETLLPILLELVEQSARHRIASRYRLLSDSCRFEVSSALTIRSATTDSPSLVIPSIRSNRCSSLGSRSRGSDSSRIDSSCRSCS